MFSRIRQTWVVKEPEQFFTTDHLQSDLKGRSVRGGAATLISQVVQIGLRMVSTTVLARLLVPEDYGLIGMTVVVTRFILLFKEVGLSTATIQSPRINHKQVSTLFWINAVVGLGLALLTIALSPAVAWFYSEPRVIGVMLALSINFLIGGFEVQHQALLRRQMRFLVISRNTVISTTVSVIAAVTAAVSGASYWSLVAMMMAQSITGLVMAWLSCGWRPSMPDLNSGIGEMLRFGGNVTGFQTVNYFSRNLDNVLIGRFWGAQALGLYSKAYELLLLPIQQINNPVSSVALPALCRLQDNPDAYRRYYFKAIMLITALGMPIVCFFFAATDQLVLLLLGEQWTEISPIFRYLAPAALVGTFNVASGWVYQSLGRVDRQFRVGIVTSVINSLIFIISIRWGVVALAAAFGLTRPLMAVGTMSYCYRGTFLKASDFVNSIYRQLLAALMAGLFCWLALEYAMKAVPLLLAIAVAMVLYGSVYFLGWLIMPNGRQELIGLLSTLEAFKKKSDAPL